MTVKTVAEATTVCVLTKDAIDRQIETLVAEMAGPGDLGAEAPRPRWISTKELVRRVQPFIVLN